MWHCREDAAVQKVWYGGFFYKKESDGRVSKVVVVMPFYRDPTELLPERGIYILDIFNFPEPVPMDTVQRIDSEYERWEPGDRRLVVDYTKVRYGFPLTIERREDGTLAIPITVNIPSHIPVDLELSKKLWKKYDGDLFRLIVGEVLGDDSEAVRIVDRIG